MRFKTLAVAAVTVLMLTAVAATVSCQKGNEGPVEVALPDETDSYTIVQGTVYDGQNPPHGVGNATVTWWCVDCSGALCGTYSPTPNAGWYWIVRDDNFSSHTGHTLAGQAYVDELGWSAVSYIYDYDPSAIPYVVDIYY
jgi:hypothetical protein